MRARFVSPERATTTSTMTMTIVERNTRASVFGQLALLPIPGRKMPGSLTRTRVKIALSGSRSQGFGVPI